MNNRDRYIRIMIIANKLYKALGNVRIEQVSDNSYYDIIVSKPRYGCTFAALVRGEDFVKSKEYKKYIINLNRADEAITVPLILFCVNVNRETVRFGIISQSDGNQHHLTSTSTMLMNTKGVNSFKKHIVSIDDRWNPNKL